MNLTRRFLLALSLNLSLAAHAANDEVKVHGEATYYSSASEAPVVARERAIEMARINALRQSFGTMISEQIMSTTLNSTSADYSLDLSEVNGEWIRDLGEPVISIAEDGRDIIYQVKVKGYAREIPHNRIDLRSNVLINGTDPQVNELRNSYFKTGDYLYVTFRSPVDGYLCIYLGDMADATMQSILPYPRQDGMASFPIEANRDYLFFSPAHADELTRGKVTRMKVFAREEIDYNTLFLIFSPNKFTKSNSDEVTDEEHMAMIDGVATNLLPRQTSVGEFHKWLGKRRHKDADMQVLKTTFAIHAR